MRILLLAMISWCICITPLPGTPEKYASGFPALDTFLRSPSGESGSVVLGMTGFYGQDQPRRWLILVKPAGNSGEDLEEYVVCDGAVVAKRKLRPLPEQDFPSIEIPRNRLKVDSDAVFLMVEDLAVTQGVSYDSVHYQLRCRDEEGEPVWMVNLLDPARNSVGIHYISALTGRVMRSVWHRTNPASITRNTSSTRSAPGLYLYGSSVTPEPDAEHRQRTLERVITPLRVE